MANHRLRCAKPAAEWGLKEWFTTGYAVLNSRQLVGLPTTDYLKQKEALIAPLLIYFKVILYRKTFAATAGTAGVRVVEIESFAV